MNILVTIMLNSYGLEQRGYSYEYFNIYLPLKEVGQEVHLFAYDTELKRRGRAGMNEALLALVADKKPDVIVVVPTTDELLPETIAAASRTCPTVAYFQDDIWRIGYSQYWARYYTYVVSTDPNGEAKFRAAGFDNVVHSPRGCNLDIYRPNHRISKDIAVSFVGMYAPYRGWLVSKLRRAGIMVQTFGPRWPTADFWPNMGAWARRRLRAAGLHLPLSSEGQIPQERMVEIFQRSKINLNLPNSVCWDVRYLASSPSAVANTLLSKKVRDGIKGRHFEICGCGGFQLTYYTEGLDKCYGIGDEIAIYIDPDELVDKVRYYLVQEDEREVIATRGLARTQREHSIAGRLAEAFRRMGLLVI
jgi:spore maturation protein CgeB